MALCVKTALGVSLDTLMWMQNSNEIAHMRKREGSQSGEVWGIPLIHVRKFIAADGQIHLSTVADTSQALPCIIIP